MKVADAIAALQKLPPDATLGMFRFGGRFGNDIIFAHVDKFGFDPDINAPTTVEIELGRGEMIGTLQRLKRLPPHG